MNTVDLPPVYLLADSQLLFWNGPGGPFFPGIVKAAGIAKPQVAYLGASNGDSLDAYGIFAAAVEQLKSARTHHVRASYSEEDREFLEAANVIVLAGGDVETGWNAFGKTGIRELLVARRPEGVVIIGVSAGAIQLGTHAALWGDDSGSGRLVEMLGLVPLIIDVHAEKEEWKKLSHTIRLMEGTAVGVGIPSGGGLAVYTDGILEPIRQPVTHFQCAEGRFKPSLLVPPNSGFEKI